MLNKKITSILLATSLFAAMSATPVFASNLDTAAGMKAVRYETKGYRYGKWLAVGQDPYVCTAIA